MGRQSPFDLHAIGCGDVEQFIDGPSRINDQALTRVTVTDEIHEILHIGRDGVISPKVTAGEELSQI